MGAGSIFGMQVNILLKSTEAVVILAGQLKLCYDFVHITVIG